MENKQYFIITTLIVGIVTALPNDEIVFEDSPKLRRMSAADSSNFASKLPSQSTCGKRKAPSFRIVGGSDSQLGAWPWMAALGYKYLNENNDSIEWLCGGTLISRTHILTAHKCVANIENRILTVARLGDLDLDPTIDDGATPLDVPIDRIIKHKEYNKWNNTNDIALLVLRYNIKFTAFIQPICLPLSPDMKNEYLGNSLPFIAGWGSTGFRTGRSTSLKEVRIPITNTLDCKQAYITENSVIDGRIICAGEGGKDSCLGDAGGPLMWFKEKQFYLMGIVSYGKKCGESNYPGVYTRVTSFLDWILEGINLNVNN